MTFEETIEQLSDGMLKDYLRDGLEMKKSGQLSKALEQYNKALEFTSKPFEEFLVWQLILHIHTDKSIGVCKLIRSNYMLEFDWPWCGNNIPSNYKDTSKDELLK